MRTLNRYRVRAFGVTRDVLRAKESEIAVDGNTVADLRKKLLTEFPQLAGLRSLYIAVNNEYADEEKVLHEGDEIALIPPVSGG
jgi:molybdopterin synthase sulfur carrier subunit